MYCAASSAFRGEAFLLHHESGTEGSMVASLKLVIAAILSRRETDLRRFFCGRKAQRILKKKYESIESTFENLVSNRALRG